MKSFTSEELQKKASEMQAYLETRAGSEPREIIERLETLIVMVAQSGSLLAQAKYLQDLVIGGALEKVLTDPKYEKFSASTLNKFIGASAKETNFLVNTFDRINSTAVHQIDSLRSILSYKKSEMLIL